MAKHYLIIGPKMGDNLQTHGGTPVLVEQLLNYCNKNSINYSFISTIHFGQKKNLKNYLYVIFKALISIPKVDIVIVNSSQNGAYYLSPIILFLTRLFRKRFIFRRFGGNCLELYKKAKGLRKRLIEYVFKNADVIFFEPKFIVDFFNKRRANVYRLPNSREASPIQRDINRPYSKKFIFLGEVRDGKGIREIVEASKELDESFTIDIYGSLSHGNLTNELFENSSIVNYKGMLEYSKVYKTMAEYDVLILPSYSEGYPGVIIEAFSVGLPIIATNIPSICEMVDSNCAKLVEPKDIKSLLEAFKFFNEDNYKSFAKASREKFKDYEVDSVHKRMLQICERRLE